MDWVVANAAMAGGGLNARIELPTAFRAPHETGRQDLHDARAFLHATSNSVAGPAA
jgi:hypothetical protein